MTPTVVDTYWATIYIAGDIAQAKQICREFCFRVGLCVTVTPTTFIYSGGEESGIAIGLINYPRFPTSQAEILNKAWNLATELKHGLFQWSFTIVTPDGAHWESDKPKDVATTPAPTEK